MIFEVEFAVVVSTRIYIKVFWNSCLKIKGAFTVSWTPKRPAERPKNVLELGVRTWGSENLRVLRLKNTQVLLMFLDLQ